MKRVAHVFLAASIIGSAGFARAEDDNASMMLDMQAAALYQQGKYQEAANLTEDALRRAVKATGPNDPSVAKYQNNLARLYALQHRDAEAELLYEHALEIAEHSHAISAAQFFSLLQGYAQVEQTLGHTDRVASLQARAEKLRKDDAARKQLWTARSREMQQFSESGRYAEAIAPAKEAVKVAEELFGPADPNLAMSLSNLAELYRVTGQLHQAETLHQRALKIRQETLGARHPAVAESLNALGHLLTTQAKYQQAKSFYEGALSINQEALGPNDFAVINTLNSLAELSLAQNHYAEAAGLYKKMMTIVETSYSTNQQDLLTIVERYAQALRQAGSVKDADAMDAKAAALRAKMKEEAPQQPPTNSKQQSAGTLPSKP